MKLPRIWRKKRGGKFYGECIATIAGEEVRLGTKNFKIATERLPAALKGAREFQGDAAAAAAALEPDVGELAAGDTGPVAEGTIPIPAPSSPTPAPPAAPLQLPAAAPANDTNAQAEAEATNAAAAETGAGDEQPGSAAAPEGFTLPPAAMEGLLKQGAQAIVLGQLQLQGWIIKKRFGRIVQPLTGEGAQQTIDIASDAWVAQLDLWFPDIKSCPPWFVALAAPLMLIPSQLENSVPDPEAQPKSEEKRADPPPAQAAA